MIAPASIAITPVLVADLLAEGERMPVYVHVIDHPDARAGRHRHDGAAPGGGRPRIPASVH
jgi:hypothetical protein